MYFCIKILILDFFSMVTAEKLSILANMLRKLYKIENFWEVHKGADSGKISFKVYNYKDWIVKVSCWELLRALSFSNLKVRKIAKSQQRSSDFATNTKNIDQLKFLPKFYQWKYGLAVNTSVCGVKGPWFRSWVTPFSFLSFKQKF